MPYPVAAVRGKNYGGASYANKVLSYSPIAYWPLWEATGAVATDISGNGYHGAYTAVTLGQTGIGDGETCPLFDGTTSFVDIYSVGFINAFDGEKGSVSVWVKMFNAGVWTDGDNRYFVTLSSNDNKNYIYLRKHGDNNKLYWGYRSNDVLETVEKSPISETGWFHVGITWSLLADKVIYYYNGSQEGATDTTLGTWAEDLTTTKCTLASVNTTPSSPFYGYLAHCAVWDSALTPAQMAILAAV